MISRTMCLYGLDDTTSVKFCHQVTTDIKRQSLLSVKLFPKIHKFPGQANLNPHSDSGTKKLAL